VGLIFQYEEVEAGKTHFRQQGFFYQLAKYSAINGKPTFRGGFFFIPHPKNHLIKLIEAKDVYF
jgi:hypothetical protein